jgi:hypothetical protein
VAACGRGYVEKTATTTFSRHVELADKDKCLFYAGCRLVRSFSVPSTLIARFRL